MLILIISFTWQQAFLFAFESVADNPTHGMTAKYKLEAATFAIDAHPTKYVFLTPEETN